MITLFEDYPNPVTATQFAQLAAAQTDLRRVLGGNVTLEATQSGGRVTIRQFVGLYADGTVRLQILPKIFCRVQAGEAVAAAKKVLRRLLRSWVSMPLRQAGQTETDGDSDLLEVLIAAFADETERLLARDRVRGYVRQAAALPVIKGKIDFSATLTLQMRCPHLTQVRYNAYTFDTPQNRILKATAQRLLPLTARGDSQQKLNRILLRLHDVTTVPLTAHLFRQGTITRETAAYRQAIEWAEQLFLGAYPSFFDGELRNIALLLPLHALFETYVADRLQALLPAGGGVRLKRQNQRRFYDGQWAGGRSASGKVYADLVLYRGDQPIGILDTKYKRGGGAQSDLFQLLGYAWVWRCPSLYLLYPAFSDLPQPTATYRFDVRCDDGSRPVLQTRYLDLTDEQRETETLRALLAELGVACAPPPVG